MHEKSALRNCNNLDIRIKILISYIFLSKNRGQILSKKKNERKYGSNYQDICDLIKYLTMTNLKCL